MNRTCDSFFCFLILPALPLMTRGELLRSRPLRARPLSTCRGAAFVKVSKKNIARRGRLAAVWLLYFTLWEAVHHGTDAARLVQHFRSSSAAHGGKAGAALPVRAVFAAAAGGRVHGAAEKSDGDGYRRGAAVAGVSGEMPAGGGGGKAETWP